MSTSPVSRRTGRRCVSTSRQYLGAEREYRTWEQNLSAKLERIRRIKMRSRCGRSTIKPNDATKCSQRFAAPRPLNSREAPGACETPCRSLRGSGIARLTNGVATPIREARRQTSNGFAKPAELALRLPALHLAGD